MDFQEEFDVVVIGAGAGGMTAAAVAAQEGLSVLLVDKAAKVGGTTAYSGGMIWIPDNAKMKAQGKEDSFERATTYLRETVPDDTAMETRIAYLRTGPGVVDYMERHTALKLQPVTVYPDYYPDLDGATTGGRVLEPVPFDASVLGEKFRLLRDPLPEFTLMDGMMVARPDIPHFRNIYKSLRSAIRVASLVLRYWMQRLRFPRGTQLVLGNALAARLLKSVLDKQVPLRTEIEVEDLLCEDDMVVGVAIKDKAGRTSHVRARRGVVLATGGFSHNQDMRKRYLPAEAGPLSATSPTATGDGLTLGMKAGGHVRDDNSNNALWVPVSTYKRKDGSDGINPHTVTDRSKPGVIAVNQAGKRFTNEAISYHEFVQAMFRAHNQSPAIPCYLVCDKTFMWKYGLGGIKPMALSLRHYKETGYLKEAASIEELAQVLGLDPASLKQTVETYNDGARRGEDPEFGRGTNAYQRFLGDAANQPNPNVRPIEDGPYYAVAVYPGDLGTAGGLVTDEEARVLDGDGKPIPGLFACGNDMNSFMNGSYPGPGITLGPAIVFGYIAAMHMAQKPISQKNAATAS